MNRSPLHALAGCMLISLFIASCVQPYDEIKATSVAAISECSSVVKAVDANEETTSLAATLEDYNLLLVGPPVSSITADGERLIVQNVNAIPLDLAKPALAVTVSCRASCNIAEECQPVGCEPSGKTCTDLTCKQNGSHGCGTPVCTRTLSGAVP